MNANKKTNGETAIVSMGVEGLDDILGGGLTPNRLYLLEGNPAPARPRSRCSSCSKACGRGEPVLYVTLSETAEELDGVARSHGWSLDGHSRSASCCRREDELEPDEQYTMFHPSEVELSRDHAKILADVDEIKPTRVVFDSLSELRLLAGQPAALPPADPGAQAVLRRPAMHRAAARRPDRGRSTTCRCRASRTA